MRKSLLLSALFSVAIPAAFAQTSAVPVGPTGAATPMATPSQAPAEITAPGHMPENRAGATAALTGSEAARSPMATPHRMMRHPMKPMHHGTAMGRMRHGMAMGQGAAPAMDGEIRPGHEPGVGESFPASDKASNITAGNTRSTIAPRLPTPAGGEDASPAMFLADAQRALNARQSGRAQEALERAETAMLHRSVAPDQANTPDQGSGVAQVRMARDALAKGDMAGAKKAVSAAMTAG